MPNERTAAGDARLGATRCLAVTFAEGDDRNAPQATAGSSARTFGNAGPLAATACGPSTTTSATPSLQGTKPVGRPEGNVRDITTESGRNVRQCHAWRAQRQDSAQREPPLPSLSASKIQNFAGRSDPSRDTGWRGPNRELTLRAVRIASEAACQAASLALRMRAWRQGALETNRATARRSITHSHADRRAQDLPTLSSASRCPRAC